MNLDKLILFIMFTGISNGNILPSEGSLLNYTQVFHRWEQIPGVEEYLLTIIDMDSDNAQEIITSSNSVIINLSEWGNSYEWSACGIINGETIGSCTETYTYSIDQLPSYFPDDITISIMESENMQEGITIMDCESLLLSVALKSDGTPVWFSPLNPAMDRFVFTQFLDNGNILGFGYGSGYEIDLAGEILYQTPTTYAVHHHFNKTESGTYFLIGAVVEEQYCPDECNPNLPDTIPWQGDVRPR